MAKDVFDDENAVKSQWMKFNVPQEDKLYGTFVGKRQIKSTMKDKEGQLQWVYEIKSDYGSFHALDDMKQIIPEAVVISEGEYWSVSKDSIDAQMRNVKLGTKIGLKLIDIVPSQTKGFNPAKNVKVFIPKNDSGTAPLMDQTWLDEQKNDEANIDGF